MKKEFNSWKIIAILFFLFGVVLFFYSEYNNKQIVNSYNDCINEKEFCITSFNESLRGWKECMYNLGGFYNVTNEEIDNEFIKYETEVIK